MVNNIEVLRQIVVPNRTTIVLLVVDGLGGLPREVGGPTELEAARTPNLDALAAQSECGLHWPIGPGITPGSGAAHLALFGFDPYQYQIGRGPMEALGVDLSLGPDDLAARANFATLGPDGTISDRRAGRLPTERTAELCGLLSGIHLPGAEVIIRAGQGHRFVVVFRRSGLSDKVSSNDPQKNGLPPQPIQALAPEAQATARLVRRFVTAANRLLAGCHPANTVLLRGFGKLPGLPSFWDTYELRAAAIAPYPMYRGIAKLVGMEPLVSTNDVRNEFHALSQHYANFDYFYLHYKDPDAAGEDGDFERKVLTIEEFDACLPQALALEPEVLVVTGDHSTPAVLKAHSWHPVPILLRSKYCRPDGVKKFSEQACRQGSLGIFRAVELMAMLLGYAQRLGKFGA